jgi:hypothetical protein
VSSLFYLLVAAVATSGAPAVGRTEAAEPDNPYDVEQLSRWRSFSTFITIGKDADGNVCSVEYNRPTPPTDEQMARLKCLGHVRSLSLETRSREVYTTLIRAWPTLRKLTLLGADPDEEIMDAISALPELRGLELREAKLPDGVVAHLKGATALEDLNLASSTITDAGLVPVGRLKGLRALDLSHDRVSNAGLRALAGLENLGTLILKDTDVDGGGLESLKGLSHLRELDLRATGIPEDSAKALSAIKGLRIQGLRTRQDKLTDDDPKCYPTLRGWGYRPDRNEAGNIDGIRVGWPGEGSGDWAGQLKGLRSLWGLAIGPMATDRELARVADAASLRNVTVWRAGITDAGLAGLPRLPRLRAVLLSGCTNITDEGLAHLERAKELVRLDLTDIPIKGPGLRHLTGLKKLTYLDLAGTAIADPALAEVAAISQLEALVLTRTAVTDAGLAHLYGMKRLAYVSPGAGVTRQGVADLVNHLPSVRDPRPRRANGSGQQEDRQHEGGESHGVKEKP